MRLSNIYGKQRFFLKHQDLKLKYFSYTFCLFSRYFTNYVNRLIEKQGLAEILGREWLLRKWHEQKCAGMKDTRGCATRSECLQKAGRVVGGQEKNLTKLLQMDQGAIRPISPHHSTPLCNLYLFVLCNSLHSTVSIRATFSV